MPESWKLSKGAISYVELTSPTVDLSGSINEWVNPRSTTKVIWLIYLQNGWHLDQDVPKVKGLDGGLNTMYTVTLKYETSTTKWHTGPLKKNLKCTPVCRWCWCRLCADGGGSVCYRSWRSRRLVCLEIIMKRCRKSRWIFSALKSWRGFWQIRQTFIAMVLF